MDTDEESRIAAAIATHERGGRPVDREDRATAANVVDRLLPRPAVRPAVLGVLAELIAHAHTRGDRKWAITLFDQLVRLNVGPVHVGVLLPEVLFLIAEPTKVDDRTRAELGFRLVKTHEFALAGPALELYLPAEEVEQWWPKLRGACLAFVDAAAARDTPYWPSHSPGLLAYLEQTLDRPLPRPAERRAGDEPLDASIMSTFDFDKLFTSVVGPVGLAVSVPIRHNLAILRAIHWGARGVLASDVEFDPRTRWWCPPERRFLVAFLSDTWKDWPRDAAQHPALERFSVALSVALDQLRDRGRIKYIGVDYDQAGGVAKVLAPVRALVEGFESDDWAICRPRKYQDQTAAEALSAFLRGVERDDFSVNERSLQELMRWWGVLGARTPEQLRERQSFFWLYRLLLCTTNAYVNAGAQYFGPVIGNTKVSLFRDVIRRWREGMTPAKAPLMALDKGTDKLADRSHNNIVRELWGFLNLQRGPFYNAQVEAYVQASEDPIDATLRIGAETRAWLEANPQKEAELSAAFEHWLARAQRSGQQPLAKVRRYERKLDERGHAVDEGAPLDMQLNTELNEQGTRYLLDLFSRRDRATIMLHLALDAHVRPEPVDGDDGLKVEVIYSPACGSGSFFAGDPPAATSSSDAAARLRAANKVWIYAPGGQASGFEGDRDQGIARVYWDQLGDLRDYASREELFAKLESLRGEDGRSPINDSKTLWTFSHVVKPGDIVVARRGLRTIVGVGEVTKSYFYVPDTKGRHRLGIDWFWTGELALTEGKRMTMRTFVDGTPRKVLLGLLERELQGQPLALPGDDVDVEPTPSKAPAKPFTIDDALSQLFFTRAQVEKWKRLLERRHNLVLMGPPGVGKTFVAKRLARLVTEDSSDDRIQIVQFHQAYSYEQFVLGYRPAGGSADQHGHRPQFELAKGPLFRLAEQAIKEPDASFVLIIDEINRGNISRILGEALMLLEGDKRHEQWGLELAYTVVDSDFADGKFYLPPNLYVIGTMNTADRSLAVVDYALRRRFAFVDVRPQIESDAFIAHARANEMPESALTRLRDRVRELNDMIVKDRALGPGFAIGHSFFTFNRKESDENATDDKRPWAAVGDPEALAHEWLDDVFDCEIEPLLAEYWAESPEQYQRAHDVLWKGRGQR